MKKDFIPGTNSNLNTFAVNYLSRLNKHSDELSLTHNEVERAKKSLESFKRSYSKMISLKAESKAATEDFYIEKKKTVDIIRKMSAQIKSSKKYTKAIGKGFNIINSPKPVTDFSKHKPVLKAKVNAKIVTIKFTKNRADGIKLYTKRVGENEFTELAYAMKGIYTDKRAKLTGLNPEAREYYAMYVVDFKIVGKRSNIIKVIIP